MFLIDKYSGRVKKNTVIVHFYGRNKPWKSNYHEFSAHYTKNNKPETEGGFPDLLIFLLQPFYQASMFPPVRLKLPK